MLAKHCLQEFKLDCQLRRLTERTIKGYYNNTSNFPDFRKNPLLYVYQTPKVVSAEQFVTQIGTNCSAPALAATAGIAQ